MARTKFILPLLLWLAACAPSPLYVERSRIGTVGEIPRDGRGEPVWSAIKQPAIAAGQPAMPAAPGIPIKPPPGY